MKNYQRLIASVALAALASTFSACGGSDPAGPTDIPIVFVDMTDVPVTATQDSVQAMAFIKAVVASNADVDEALRVEAAELSVSDSAEPEDEV
jgi:hypothetical protein